MNKAEERAWNYCMENKLDPYSMGHAYADGYHQAEKDLELTWEDIKKIVDLYDDVYCDFSIDGKGGKTNTEEHYQEVLKRFKAQKGEEV